MATIFRTPRLIVREWEPADFDRFFDMYSREEVTRWLSNPNPLVDLDEARDIFDSRYVGQGVQFGRWAIEVAETGIVAGTVLLRPFQDREEIEVGWHLHPDSHKRGYATEAASGAVQLGLSRGYPEIYAVAFTENEPSLAVMRRIGMTSLGRTDRFFGVELECYVIRPTP